MIKMYSSGVVPFAGLYRVSHIDVKEFKDICDTYRPHIESYLGYENCVKFVNKVTGLDLIKNKKSDIMIKEGDIILVCKVRGRMSHLEKINLHPKDEDFELAKIEYLGAN